MKDKFDEELIDTPVFTMVDEDGNNYDFEYLGEVEYQGRDFMVVLDAEQADEEVGNPVIIEVLNNEDGDSVYETVTDDELANQVFQIFKDENPEDFIYMD